MQGNHPQIRQIDMFNQQPTSEPANQARNRQAQPSTFSYPQTFSQGNNMENTIDLNNLAHIIASEMLQNHLSQTQNQVQEPQFIAHDPNRPQVNLMPLQMQQQRPQQARYLTSAS
jgi:hypothetical protein